MLKTFPSGIIGILLCSSCAFLKSPSQILSAALQTPVDFLRSLPDLSSSLADSGSFSWEKRELAILRREKEGGEVDVTSLGSTPWTDWTKAKWQCGTSEGHCFLNKRLLMFQFMSRAATAKLRVDWVSLWTQQIPRRPPIPWWIFLQLSSEINASKEVCGGPLCVWREMMAHSSGDYYCRGEALWRARQAAGGGSKHIWRCFSYLPCSL